MANTNPLQIPSNTLVEQLRNQMRRMLVRLDEIRLAAPQETGHWRPPIDILELGDTILVRIELPGVAREHIRISVIDNTIKIEGRKDREAPTGRLGTANERPVRFVCLERSYGGFAFAVALKWQIDPAGVQAQLAEGVLQIKLPKTSTSGREISIPIED